MEGKSLDDACAAQRSLRGLPAISKYPSNTTAKPPIATFSASAHAIPVQSTSGQQAFLHDGILYHIAPAPGTAAPCLEERRSPVTTYGPPVHGGDFAGLLTEPVPMNPGDVFEHAAWNASDTLAASVDWSLNSCALTSDDAHSGILVQTSARLLLKDSPFFLDTGATTHLLPE